MLYNAHMNKSYAILHIYTKLMDGNSIKSEECCNEYQISMPTFYRYLAFLRNYFCEELGAELIYDKKSEQYFLQKGE